MTPKLESIPTKPYLLKLKSILPDRMIVKDTVSYLNEMKIALAQKKTPVIVTSLCFDELCIPASGLNHLICLMDLPDAVWPSQIHHTRLDLESVEELFYQIALNSDHIIFCFQALFKYYGHSDQTSKLFLNFLFTDFGLSFDFIQKHRYLLLQRLADSYNTKLFLTLLVKLEPYSDDIKNVVLSGVSLALFKGNYGITAKDAYDKADELVAKILSRFDTDQTLFNQSVVMNSFNEL